MSQRALSDRRFLLLGVLLSLVLAGVVSFYASGHPDGLEFVAERLGFAPTTPANDPASPLADYAVKGIDNEGVAGGLAGVIGVLATGAIAFALMWVLRRRPATAIPGATQPRPAPGTILAGGQPATGTIVAGGQPATAGQPATGTPAADETLD